MILSALCVLEALALCYIAAFTRVVWRKDGPNWIYHPHPSEEFVWNDHGRDFYLVASEADGAGGTCFALVEGKESRREILTEYRDGHLKVANFLRENGRRIDLIDNQGRGFPDEKLVSEGIGNWRKYVLNDVDWKEVAPGGSPAGLDRRQP